MFLQQRFNYFSPPQFQGTGATLLGTTQKYQIDRTWPIEEIILHIGFNVTTALTLFPLTAQSSDQSDNILQLIQHINLSVNDGKQPRSVVDCSGVGILEYVQQTGLNLDQATMTLVALSGVAAGYVVAGGSNIVGPVPLPVGFYQLTYRISMVHPWIGEPIRSRMYLPVHTYPQDPVLSLTFQSLANICTAGAIGAMFVDVQLIRRVATAASETLLRANPGTNPNGYIDWDLIETPFGIGTGITSEQRFPLPIPGAYMDLLFRQYLGGTNVLRNPVDGSGTGCSTATGQTYSGFGNESRWRLETGLVVMREWRWKHLRAINDFSRPNNTTLVIGSTVAGPLAFLTVQSSSGNIGSISPFAPNGGSVLCNFRNPVSCMLNFLSDGLSGDTGVELGSLLDCNTPANNGLKMEVIGNPANVATNGSMIAIMGRRLFGDLSRWQKFS
jgi:hypothetical protein